MTKENQKIAIHCPTEELWERVSVEWEKLHGHRIGNHWVRYNEESCLRIRHPYTVFSSKSYYEREGYTIIPAEEYLLWGTDRTWTGLAKKMIGKERELKVGDRVEVVSGDWTNAKEGEIVSIDGSWKPYKVALEGQGGGTIYFDKQDLKLIESEDSIMSKDKKCLSGEKGCECKHCTPTYTVTLRERDEVRVVGSYCSYNGESGELTKIAGNIIPYRVKFSNYKHWYNLKDLELIPTEKDITVGSVWEYNKCKFGTRNGEERKVKSIEGVQVWLDSGAWTSPSALLSQMKLIHRGDEVGGILKVDSTSVWIDDCAEAVRLLNKKTDELKPKTNKKEKKMKTKTIAEGLPIIDKACDNLGVVVYYDYESGEVAYKELSGKHCIGHIDNIQLAPVQVVMPEPKPEKKVVKKKTAKKKTTKKKVVKKKTVKKKVGK